MSDNPQQPPTLDPSEDARYIEKQVKRYEDRLQQLVGDLNELARRVAREGKAQPRTIDGVDDKPDYLDAAGAALHTLNWGIANLNVRNLMDAAADAHNAVRGRYR